MMTVSILRSETQALLRNIGLQHTLSSEFDYILIALALLGFFQVAFAFRSFFFALVNSFLRTGKNLRNLGKWAVVTGGSDGIGLAYAEALAAKGMSICLIARDKKKLDDCAASIKKQYGVETSVIVANLPLTPEISAKLQKSLNDLGEIGVLINNVGVSYEHAEFFDKLDDERIKLLIALNIEATTFITKMVIPGMLERRRGAIVNIGSAAGYMPTGNPMYEVYSGCKAYVDFFSRSLELSYRSKGITVECHHPYLVPSKLSKIRNPGLFIPSAKSYGKAGVAVIGSGQVTVLPHWRHKLEHFIYFSILPRFFFEWNIMNLHLDIRKRALKKKEKGQ